jgi:hypothetical protein
MLKYINKNDKSIFLVEENSIQHRAIKNDDNYFLEVENAKKKNAITVK